MTGQGSLASGASVYFALSLIEELYLAQDPIHPSDCCIRTGLGR